MNNNSIEFSNQAKPYKSHETRVVFVKMQGILCDSGVNGESKITEMEEGDNNW